MRDRWRGRSGGLAIIGLLAITLGGCTVEGRMAASPRVILADGDGASLARIVLPADGSFSLAYRNSLYGTAARETFVVEGGRLRLERLWAEQLAVLEEYYAIDEPARPAPDGAGWTAEPATSTILDELRVAATDLGQRTLLVEGRNPLPLHALVADDDPTILITVEGG